MGSEVAVEEVEKGAPEPHGSPPGGGDPATPEDEGKRGTKRESPEKEEGEEAEESAKKRPSRERKTVERYSALSPRKQPASKALSIEQGSGTKLKDIPNVAFKISKRKADENLQALHTILFGRKSNAHYLKRNIFQFSGFVWSDNEEKHRTKVKEKLDKYTKDKLVDFCELLDIHFPKATTKKEEISAKLLEFLESPLVTRELLLADKERKGKKRRSRTKPSKAAAGDASSDKETKKRKKRSGSAGIEKGQKETTKSGVEDEDSVGLDGLKDASSDDDGNSLQEESDHAKHEEEDSDEEPPMSNEGADDALIEDVAEPKAKQTTGPTKKSDKNSLKRVSKKIEFPVEEDEAEIASAEPAKKTSKSVKKKASLVGNGDKKKSSKKSAPLDTSELGPSKCSNSKGKDKVKDRSEEKAAIEEKKIKKKEEKPASKVSAKKQGKGKKSAGPSREELHSVISNLLKEVDFNTATLADILKKLGTHFDISLMDRKAEVKSIIEEVINSMTDDEEAPDDKDEDGEGDEKNEGSDEDGE